MPLFLCRLNGPRATFPQDMTQAERGLMGEHAGHWLQKMRTGEAVVFGPVADPAGFWGLGVLECAGADEARSFTQSDPVIRGGAGFSYEIHPMPGAVAHGRANPAS
jgi:hypothetical protein